MGTRQLQQFIQQEEQQYGSAFYLKIKIKQKLSLE